MKATLAHAQVALRLHFRNPLALVYGYLFPLVFLAVFWVIYRHEQIPLARHCGELLTVGILGGACFGLPTTLVSERERGLWRRYRVTPVPAWVLIASTAIVRFVILLSAGVLQMLVLRATGVPWPSDPLTLLLAFTCSAFAFIGLGLVIAMLADNVPAVQALGQCVFLPMLVIGGVAVPLGTLPEWAQQVSAFFPGRYAVEAIQAGFNGMQTPGWNFALGALVLNGIAGCVAASLLFRWETGGASTRPRRHWAGLVLGCWLALGFAAGNRGVEPAENRIAREATPSGAAWMLIRPEQVAGLDYRLPPDAGVVTPFSRDLEASDSYVAADLAVISDRLSAWVPGNDADPLRATRNLVYAAAVTDMLQQPHEQYLPHIVLRHLRGKYPEAQLVQMLTWIALHPEEGVVIESITDLGIPGAVGDEDELRQRMRVYATKFVARLTNRSYEGMLK